MGRINYRNDRVPADLLARLLKLAKGATLQRVEDAYLFLDWFCATRVEAELANDAKALEALNCVDNRDFVGLRYLWARWVESRNMCAALMKAEAGIGGWDR